ncbi:MAG: hypothetical protein LBG80_19120 [Bacteroidales bacterium]|jgi:proteic killer suppression protein|nr:hypothetical protein [Bacteroidales bacterium]
MIVTFEKKYLEELWKFGKTLRVNNKYRVEFIVKKDFPSITICNITELSNHYKK